MTFRTSRCAALALAGGLALAVSAQAQQSQTPGTARPATPPAAAPGATPGTSTPAPLPQRSDSSTSTTPGMSGTTGNAVRSGDPTSGAGPRAGANSFTEGQARSRIESAGFTNVTGLNLDGNGIWRGQAMRGGSQVQVTLDYQGNVNAR